MKMKIAFVTGLVVFWILIGIIMLHGYVTHAYIDGIFKNC